MSWITVDTELDDHAKIAALPNDAARWGWLKTLLKAKKQRTPGTFASEAHYRYVIGRHARFLSDYLKVRLLDKDEDGSLHVHDWRKHQWAGAKAQQRETSVGHSEDIDETFLGQKEDASRAVPVPVYVRNGTEGGAGGNDALSAFHRRTGEVPGAKIRNWLNEVAEAHGEARFVAKIEATPMTGSDIRVYIRALRDEMRLEDAAAERAELADEKRRNAEKRAAVEPLPPAADVSPEEARRLAEEYTAEARAGR